MRRASHQAWCEAPRPPLIPCPGGGAQHRQPVARRPCGHERSKTPTRTRPKNVQKYLKLVFLLTTPYLCAV
ncbi:MAG: hypothetical protein NZ455_01310 [Bacteroidia bacterium]|nr:hypothetical protein [Bacteroidia bacterium]MDW8346521.1 hypothetical protein [Bacteroidia bacterium]